MIVYYTEFQWGYYCYSLGLCVLLLESKGNTSLYIIPSLYLSKRKCTHDDDDKALPVILMTDHLVQGTDNHSAELLNLLQNMNIHTYKSWSCHNYRPSKCVASYTLT